MADERHDRSATRIALYSGLCVRHDAISNSLRHKLDVIDKWRSAGAPVEAMAFVHGSDSDDPHIRRVENAGRLLRMPEFCRADVHVFEFGIYYPLFDAVFLLPERARSIGIYHNVTPPELVDDPGLRAVLERSLLQRHNLWRMTHVASDSEFSRRQLLSLGLPPEMLSVLSLPPGQTASSAPASGRRHRNDRVEVLYVGRFVRSKGVLDLLDAVSAMAPRVHPPFRLTLAGNPALSAVEVVDEVRRRCAGPERSFMRMVPAPDDAALARLYSEADVFVIPSYHEGYCVPVIEALSAGCQVVAYDSSNLPFILDGLGSLVPTGDVTALAQKLEEVVHRIGEARIRGTAIVVPTDHGDVGENEWRARVAAHVQGHGLDTFEANFARVLVDTAGADMPDFTRWLRECGPVPVS